MSTSALEVSYYPGCSLHGMAAEYDESIRAVCETLDVTLAELEDWNCCGASSAHFMDDELAVRLSARNMAMADRGGLDLLVPCAACFQRMKHADKELKADAPRWGAERYEGKAAVYHVNDFFQRPDLMAAVKRRTSKPLAGSCGGDIGPTSICPSLLRSTTTSACCCPRPASSSPACDASTRPLES